MQFEVCVYQMTESHRLTYWVCLTNSDRPKDATIFDTDGKVTPFMSENPEHAVLDAKDWAEFLGVSENEISYCQKTIDAIKSLGKDVASMKTIHQFLREKRKK